jgi:tripartite-type tricarboxylate transporter receptor subunit TctC
VRAGTIKAYAVTDKARLAAAPDIPTVDEAGVPGLHIAIWHALWMPKGTPKDIIAKLNGAVVDALADAGVRKRLADLGQDISAARGSKSADTRGLPQGRDREVVADPQGREHQGRINPAGR